MANMTVSTPETLLGSKLKKVTFTHTVAGTAAGSTTTSTKINGTLLRVETTGGDGDWDFTLNDGTTNIFAITGINVAGTANTWPLGIAFDGSSPNAATDVAMWGIPMAGQALTCTTAKVSDTAPTITVIYREE